VSPFKKLLGQDGNDLSSRFPAAVTIAFSEFAVKPHVDSLNDDVFDETVIVSAPIPINAFDNSVISSLEEKGLGCTGDVMITVIMYGRKRGRTALERKKGMTEFVTCDAGDRAGLEILGHALTDISLSYEQKCLTITGYEALNRDKSHYAVRKCKFDGMGVVSTELPDRLVSGFLSQPL